MAVSSENMPPGGEGGARDGAQPLNTKPLFKLMVDKKASDLFFTANSPIKIKIEGVIHPVNRQVIPAEAVRQIAFGLMTAEQLEYFSRELEIDFAISEPGVGRFRANVFYQRGYPAIVLRYISSEVPSFEPLSAMTRRQSYCGFCSKSASVVNTLCSSTFTSL